MESRLADLGPTATSPPPKPPVSPSISPSQSIGSVCVTPSAASSTVEVRLPAIRQSACCAGVGAAVSAASTLVSASNCRGHFLFSQLRKGAWLPRSFTLSTDNPQLSPSGRGNASPVEDSPWRATDPLSGRSPGRFRVSAGLLNPSGGARNRPRTKSVLAQKKNELNKDF